jgi:hypothetical protein
MAIKSKSLTDENKYDYVVHHAGRGVMLPIPPTFLTNYKT